MSKQPEQRPCVRCGAPIIFITMEATGRKMPCDSRPQYGDGKTPLIVSSDGGITGKMVMQPGGSVYGRVSHFGTCPDYLAEQKEIAAEKKRQAKRSQPGLFQMQADDTGIERAVGARVEVEPDPAPEVPAEEFTVLTFPSCAIVPAESGTPEELHKLNPILGDTFLMFARKVKASGYKRFPARVIVSAMQLGLSFSGQSKPHVLAFGGMWEWYKEWAIAQDPSLSDFLI